MPPLAPVTSSTSSTPASTGPTMSTSIRTIGPSDGSRTLVVAKPEHDKGEGSRDESPPPPRTLRLRGGPRSRPRVAWDTDVIDNEHMGKKKSKICCIYHKPKAFNESSDESSDDGSDIDSAPSDDGSARPSQRSGRPCRCTHGNHEHTTSDTRRSTESSDSNISHHHNHQHQHRHPDNPNAYESQPAIKGKGRANAI